MYKEQKAQGDIHSPPPSPWPAPSSCVCVDEWVGVCVVGVWGGIECRVRGYANVYTFLTSFTLALNEALADLNSCRHSGAINS